MLGMGVGWRWDRNGVAVETSVGQEWGGDGVQQRDKDGEGGGTRSALSPCSPPRALLDPVVSLALLVLL